MDSLITASARALCSGDVLGALKRVALRDDPPALALRGIAMAQLGEHARARELLRRAARTFGVHEELARARCVVAEAEVALAMRDLRASPRSLAAAVATLEAHGDRANALHAQVLSARRLLLLGQVRPAAAAMARLPIHHVPPALAAVVELTLAELSLRSLHIDAARDALARAHAAANRAQVPALIAEVADARASLSRPAARRIYCGREEALRIDEVAALLASDALVVDARRRGLGAGEEWQSFARRPVLFALARALAEAWPGDASRDSLIRYAFGMRDPDESYRARLRVELGRLRALVKRLADIEATGRGFILRPHGRRTVIVLAPPVDGEQASLLALLSDGAAWSTSALAMALGTSQRTIQRSLLELEEAGRVRSVGNARARRWLSPPLVEITTILLLPAALAVD
jgi:hypothetical protein